MIPKDCNRLVKVNLLLPEAPMSTRKQTRAASLWFQVFSARSAALRLIDFGGKE